MQDLIKEINDQPRNPIISTANENSYWLYINSDLDKKIRNALALREEKPTLEDCLSPTPPKEDLDMLAKESFGSFLVNNVEDKSTRNWVNMHIDTIQAIYKIAFVRGCQKGMEL